MGSITGDRASSQASATCAGDATPIPRWDVYAQFPDSVPSECRDGTSGTVFASSLPSVTLVDRNYSPSRRISTDLNWRGSVLANRFMATVTEWDTKTYLDCLP